MLDDSRWGRLRFSRTRPLTTVLASALHSSNVIEWDRKHLIVHNCYPMFLTDIIFIFLFWEGTLTAGGPTWVFFYVRRRISRKIFMRREVPILICFRERPLCEPGGTSLWV